MKRPAVAFWFNLSGASGRWCICVEFTTLKSPRGGGKVINIMYVGTFS